MYCPARTSALTWTAACARSIILRSQSKLVFASEVYLYIPPWSILSGLGTLSRRELSLLLPHFEDTSLANVAADKLRDVVARLDGSRDAATEAAFRRRLVQSADRITASDAPDRALRVRLWVHLLAPFGIETPLPLSTRTANACSAALAHRAAETLALEPEQEVDGASLLAGAWKRVTARFGRSRPDFSGVVVAQAELVARAVADAAQRGALADDDQKELVRRMRAQLDGLPPELRNDAVEQALKSGDAAIIGLLASGTSLLGVGVVVNLAGFSAYILAAQAAAIIPFIGGSTAVSMLFVLANPLFIGPAMALGAYLAGRHVRSAHGKRLSSSLTVQLALKGVAAGRAGLRRTLDDFKSLSAADVDGVPEKHRDRMLSRLAGVKATVGAPLPPTPWPPEGRLARPAADAMHDPLERMVFAKTKADVGEALAIGGVTAADILYHAAAIDPAVLSAADFSSAADLCSISDFSVFAGGVGSMAAASAAGAANNLRGYVAEQIAATCLVDQGHVVSFPETPNNPGVDLWVDGHAFQVKCLGGVDGLREHFERYPEVPVLANAELAEAVAASSEDWAGRVFCVEGFDRETTDLVMRAALDAGAALDDMDVPYVAAALSATRNVYGWWRGDVPLADLPLSVVLDGAIKGGLAAAGGLSGKALGLLLFGPAGALVFGGVGGAAAILGSSWTRQQATRLLSDDWVGSLDEATDRLRRALIGENRAKIGLLTEKRARIAEHGHEQRAWFLARMSDDVVALAEHIHHLETDVVKEGQPERARLCLQSMKDSAVHPWAVREELADVVRVLDARPSLGGAASKKARAGWSALLSAVPRHS